MALPYEVRTLNPDDTYPYLLLRLADEQVITCIRIHKAAKQGGAVITYSRDVKAEAARTTGQILITEHASPPEEAEKRLFLITVTLEEPPRELKDAVLVDERAETYSQVSPMAVGLVNDSPPPV